MSGPMSGEAISPLRIKSALEAHDRLTASPKLTEHFRLADSTVAALAEGARRYLALTGPGEPDAGSCEEVHGEHFAGMCTSCGGDVYHRPGKPGEYDHECTSGGPAEGPNREVK